MTRLAAILLAILLAVPAVGRSATKFTVEAGQADRVNQPLEAKLPAQLELAPGNYRLSPEAADSAAWPAQVQKAADGLVIRWIEPKLAAGSRRTYDVSPDPSAQPIFTSTMDDAHRDLRFGDTPVLRDMIQYDPADRENTYKTYTHVFDFHNKDAFITKGPGGKYPHHRGIFFGTKVFDENKTTLGDWWHCTNGISQRHDKYLADREFLGPVAAREAQVVNWDDKDGKPIVRDTRQLTIWRISPTRYVIDCDVTVESLIGKPLTLGGDAHHAGLHFRAAQEVADAKDPAGKAGSATYIRPPTAKLIKDDIYSGCPWVHMSFTVNGHHYQLTHMDGPDNPKPTTYSTRPYGRVGAFFTADTTPDKPLHLLYRLVLWEGAAPTADELAAAYASFVTPVKVTP
jgi:hypothetical protein